MSQAVLATGREAAPATTPKANVLFVQNVWHEQLGVGFLSAVLKRVGYATRVEVWGTDKQLKRALAETDPLFVGVPVISGSHGWAGGVAARLKALRPDLPVIMGGPHPTFYPAAVKDRNFDAVVRGEGEGPVLDIAETLFHGGAVEDLRGVDNIVLRNEHDEPTDTRLRTLIPTLDEIGRPDREIYRRLPYLRRETLFPVLTTRGCPYSCSYCFNAHYRELYKHNGKLIRIRDLHDVLDECRELRDAYGATCINFVDDIFGLKKDWALEFLARYKTEVGVPFLCNTKSDLFNEDMAAALSDAGCHALQYGLESSGEEIRKTLRRTDKDHHFDNLSLLAKKHRLNQRAYFMIGVPGQGLQGSLDTIQMAHDMGVKYGFVSIFQPYPGTQLGDLLRAQGVVDEHTYLDSMRQSALVKSVVKDKEQQAIENLQKFSLLLLVWPGLKKVVLPLCRLPRNKVFDLVYLLSFCVSPARLPRRSLLKTLHYGIKNIRFYTDSRNDAGLPAGP